MTSDVDHRCSSDSTLLWLWCRPEAKALIQSLAQELPYATGVAKKTKKKKKKKKFDHSPLRSASNQLRDF